MPRKYIHFRPEDSPGGTGGGDSGNGDDTQGGGTGGAPQEGTPAPQEGTGETVPAAKFKEVQNEARNLRARAKAAEDKVAEFESATKTDVERITGERDKLRDSSSELTGRVRDLTVEVLAAEVGIPLTARPDVAKLVDWSQIKDPTDRDEVKEALSDLVKEKPYLLGVAGGADGGASGGSSANGQDMNTLLRQAAGR